MRRQQVVIYVQRAAMAAEAEELIDAIRRDGTFEPVTISNDMASSLAAPRGTSRSLKARVPYLAAIEVLRVWAALAKTALRFRNEVPADTAAIVLFDDRAPLTNLMRIRKARSAGIGTLLVPYADTSPQSDAMSRREAAGHAVEHGLLSPIWAWLGRLAPHHVRHDNGRPLFFYGRGATAALWCAGFGRLRPWVLGGGGVDVVGVLGAADAAARCAAGVPVDRVVEMGPPTHDRLARASALTPNDLAQRLPHVFHSSAKPLIIVVMPQYAEHGQRDWQEHWRLTRELLRAATTGDARVLVSLHPRSIPADYTALAEEYGCAIADHPLADILPTADIFVSGYSSTAWWAIRLGIPTVIADLAGLNLPTFAKRSDIPVCTDETALAAALQKLVSDPHHRAKVRATVAGVSSDLVAIDGKASERVIAQLKKLATRKRPADVS